MKRTSVRLLLLGLVLALSLIPSATPTAKADAIGNCGDIYTKQTPSYYWWGSFPVPYLKTQACVNCDGGTFCYDVHDI